MRRPPATPSPTRHWRDKLALWQARYISKPTLWLVRTPQIMRVIFNAKMRLTTRVPSGVSRAWQIIGDTRCLTFGAPSQQVILYLHGGGFVMGGPATHGAFAAHLAARSLRRVVLPDYPLAPEAPFPAALDSIARVYDALLKTHAPQDICIAGDSAGGGLALALLHICGPTDTPAARPAPGAMIALSPVGDLRWKAGDILRRAAPDALLPKVWIEASVHAYALTADRADPRLSPLAQPFPVAPRTLVQYAKDELLADQASDIAHALGDAGADVTLTAYPGTFHAFQIDLLPLSHAALDQMVRFLDDSPTSAPTSDSAT